MGDTERYFAHPAIGVFFMANPQKEEGFIPIAREIALALACANITQQEHKFLWALWIKTYGYHKKEDWVSGSQFVELTKMRQEHVFHVKRSLLEKNVIYQKGRIIGFNKDYESWVLHGGAVLREQAVSTAPLGSLGTAPLRRHKRKTYKRETTKEKQPHIAAHSAAGALVVEAFIQVDPKNKTYYGNTTQRKACDFLINEYTLDLVLARIKILSQTNRIPYFPSIRSPYDLKEKWVQLENAVERKKQEIKSKKVDIIL